MITWNPPTWNLPAISCSLSRPHCWRDHTCSSRLQILSSFASNFSCNCCKQSWDILLTWFWRDTILSIVSQYNLWLVFILATFCSRMIANSDNFVIIKLWEETSYHHCLLLQTWPSLDRSATEDVQQQQDALVLLQSDHTWYVNLKAHLKWSLLMDCY